MTGWVFFIFSSSFVRRVSEFLDVPLKVLSISLKPFQYACKTYRDNHHSDRQSITREKLYCYLYLNHIDHNQILYRNINENIEERVS